MHTMNKTRDAKGLLRIWRYQPNRLLTKVGKDFAEKVRETLYFEKYMQNRRRTP